MRYGITDYTVVYVDPSIASGGDGTTPATALKTLPAAASLANGACYLIRRTATTSVLSLPSGTSAVTSIMFLGMPKSTDRFYSVVPAEAKAAWDSDAADYAQIQSTSSSTQLAFSTVVSFTMSRCNLTRKNVSSTSTSYYMIAGSSTSGNYKSCWLFDHCRFGVDGYDVDSEEWASSYTSNGMGSYVKTGVSRLVELTDCVINWRYYNSCMAFYCPYTDMFSMHGCTVNQLLDTDSATDRYAVYATTSTGGGGYSVGPTGTGTTVASVTGCTFNYLVNGSSGGYYLHSMVRLEQFQHTTVAGCTLAMLDPTPSSHPSSALVMKSSAIYLYKPNEFRISGLSGSLPYLAQFDQPLLYVAEAPTNDRYHGYERVIENCTLSVGTSPIGTLSSSYTTYGIWGSSGGAGNSAWSTGGKYMTYVYVNGGSDNASMYKPVIVRNCTFTNSDGPCCYFMQCRVTGTVVNGLLSLDRSVADVTSISSNWPGKVIRCSSCSHLRVGTVTVNKNNADYPYASDPVIYESSAYYGNVYIGSCNVPLGVGHTTSTKYAYGTRSCANAGETGHYTLFGDCVEVDTWNVYRTGGSPACLKFTNATYDNADLVTIGRMPFSGMLLEAEDDGDYLLEMHVAAKGYDSLADLPWKFIVEATVDEDHVPRSYFSSTDGQWLDDSSAEWNNDDGLAQLKLSLPIHVEHSSDPVDVRIHFGWYSTTGFIYVDPEITITPVSRS